MQIDMEWQTMHIGQASTTLMLKRCLINSGIVPSETHDEMQQQIVDNGLLFENCPGKQEASS